MPRSMTGFGAGQAEDADYNLTVEIKSVNNRFFDLNLRAPRILMAFETTLRDIISAKIKRGRISIFVNEEAKSEGQNEIAFDRTKALAYAKKLESLREELNLKGELQIGNLLSINDLFVSRNDGEKQDRIWELTKRALNIALDNLIEVSSTEGEALCMDILSRNALIGEEVAIIKSTAIAQVTEYSSRLKSRLEELLKDSRLDPVRLEMEIALTADRLDISEEIVRLESHCGIFKQTLDSDEPVGKSLNFILQEMGREANTIASKAWAIEISQSAIKVKELIEQIREQVQNLE